MAQLVIVPIVWARRLYLGQQRSVIALQLRAVAAATVFDNASHIARNDRGTALVGNTLKLTCAAWFREACYIITSTTMHHATLNQ